MFIYTDRLPHHFHIEINCSIPSCNIEPNCKGKPPQDDVITRKHIPHYWPAVRGIHQWPFIPAQRASDVEMSQRNYYHQQSGFTVCVKRQTINQCHADSDLVLRWLYAFYSEYLRNANIKKKFREIPCHDNATAGTFNSGVLDWPTISLHALNRVLILGGNSRSFC